MLSFKFELAPYPEEKIDGLTQGHLIIQGKDGVLNLKDKNETIMVFITISDFLWQIQRLVTEEKRKSDFFNGVDSSIFNFVINKSKDGKFSIVYKDGIIDIVNANDLVSSFWRGVEDFLNVYLKEIAPYGSVFSDLRSAVIDFTKAFNIKQSFFN